MEKITESIMTPKPTEMELKILEAAREVFLEKGYNETSIGDIADRVGVHRPAIHYYFRTKERIFQDVFGMIISQVVPQIQDIIRQKDRPVAERVGRLVDMYFDIYRKHPTLPLFVLNEMHRDINFLVSNILRSPMHESFSRLIAGLREDMAAGKLNTVPLSVLFYTFYGLVTSPFLTKHFSDIFFDDEAGDSFDKRLEQWKPYIVMQMTNLLAVKTSGGA